MLKAVGPGLFSRFYSDVLGVGIACLGLLMVLVFSFWRGWVPAGEAPTWASWYLGGVATGSLLFGLIEALRLHRDTAQLDALARE